jgi:chromosome segregation ATPase
MSPRADGLPTSLQRAAAKRANAKAETERLKVALLNVELERDGLRVEVTDLREALRSIGLDSGAKIADAAMRLAILRQITDKLLCSPADTIGIITGLRQRSIESSMAVEESKRATADHAKVTEALRLSNERVKTLEAALDEKARESTIADRQFREMVRERDTNVGRVEDLRREVEALESERDKLRDGMLAAARFIGAIPC